MAVHAHRYTAAGAWLPQGDYVSDSLRQRGVWEFSDGAAGLERLAGIALPLTGTFLDIGAHAGYWTFILANRGLDVLAIEPMAHNRRAMHATRCADRQLRERVSVLPLALSASGARRCVMRSFGQNNGNGQMHCTTTATGSIRCPSAWTRGTNPNTGAQCEEVRTHTL